MSPETDWGIGDVRSNDPLLGSGPSGMSETLYGLVRNYLQSPEAASLLRRTFDLVPQNAGDIKAIAGIKVPTGWLFCDGSTYDQSAYPQLYAAIGQSWGGTGSSFKVPDLRGKVLVCQGILATTGTNYAQFAYGGEETHTILAAELPAHTHSVRLRNDGNVTAGNFQIGSAGNTFGFDPTGTVGGSGADSGTTGSTGSGTAANNMQPYAVISYIIFSGV